MDHRYNAGDMDPRTAAVVERWRLVVGAPEKPAAVVIESSHGPARSLVKDGVWQVPASERPKGWENMGLREI